MTEADTMDATASVHLPTQFVDPIAAIDEAARMLSGAGGTEAAAQHQEAQEWLGVRVGPFGLLLPAMAARELLDPPPTARLPHTPLWFVGLANVRGALVPVVDAAQALGVVPDMGSSAVRRYLLIFGHGDEILGLIVDGLPHRQGFAAGERLHGLPPHPSLLDGHLSAAYGHQGQLWFEVDLDGFFRTLGERLGQG